MTKDKIEEILTYDNLYDLYRNQLKTIDEIEEITKVGHTTISKYLDILNIERMTVTERNLMRNKNILLTDIQNQVINGALLGDGTIAINKNNYLNGYFSYSSTSFQHVNYIYEYLKEYCINGISIVKIDGKNDVYHFNTKKLGLFSDIWSKWYAKQDNKYYKYYIPNDLKLTPLICLVWYIGDGGLRTRTINRNYSSQTLSLATNNFKKECIEDILIPQLSSFDAYIESTVKKDQYLTTIPRRKIKDFLDYIGECPFDEYKYKWNVVPYQRTRANDSIIIDLYNKGYTYTEIQDITGCGRTTLVTHVKKLKEQNILIGRYNNIGDKT